MAHLSSLSWFVSFYSVNSPCDMTDLTANTLLQESPGFQCPTTTYRNKPSYMLKSLNWSNLKTRRLNWVLGLVTLRWISHRDSFSSLASMVIVSNHIVVSKYLYDTLAMIASQQFQNIPIALCIAAWTIIAWEWIPCPSNTPEPLLIVLQYIHTWLPYFESCLEVFTMVQNCL